jgi:hypothetical protein
VTWIRGPPAPRRPRRSSPARARGSGANGPRARRRPSADPRGQHAEPQGEQLAQLVVRRAAGLDLLPEIRELHHAGGEQRSDTAGESVISGGGEVPSLAWMSVAAVTARPATCELVGRVESLKTPTSCPAESLVRARRSCETSSTLGVRSSTGSSPFGITAMTAGYRRAATVRNQSNGRICCGALALCRGCLPQENRSLSVAPCARGRRSRVRVVCAYRCTRLHALAHVSRCLRRAAHHCYAGASSG